MAEDLIVANPQILDGKPCIRGTRLSVEFLLELAASGATQEQILAQYPQLTSAEGRAHLGAENHGVTPLDFPLLTDENIAPDVVSGLRARGRDLRSARDEQLIGRPDVDVLERATAQGRVVVTHDVASGRSAIRAGASFVGIIYPRPGHISAKFVLEIVDALRRATAHVQPPFICYVGVRKPTLQYTVA